MFIETLNKMYNIFKKHLIFLINSLLYTLSQYLLQYTFFGHNLEGLEKNRKIVVFITNSQYVICLIFVCIAFYFAKLIKDKKSGIAQIIISVVIYVSIILILDLFFKVSILEYIVILSGFFNIFVILLIPIKLKDLKVLRKK